MLSYSWFGLRGNPRRPKGIFLHPGQKCLAPIVVAGGQFFLLSTCGLSTQSVLLPDPMIGNCSPSVPIGVSVPRISSTRILRGLEIPRIVV